MASPSSVRPRPSRPSWRRRAGGRAGPAPPERSASGRSAAEDGEGRLFCFAMQSARRRDATRVWPGGKSPPSPLPARAACRSARPLRRPGRGPLARTGRAEPPARRHATAQAHPVRRAGGCQKRATSSGASCDASQPAARRCRDCRRSSLKSPQCGASTIASIPAACARSASVAAARRPAGSLSRAM